MSTFLLRRPVDRSLLTNGFHIPTELHPMVYVLLGGEHHHGDKRKAFTYFYFYNVAETQSMIAKKIS